MGGMGGVLHDTGSFTGASCRFVILHFKPCIKLIGPHLRNERTTEIWAYGRFYAKLGIYQYGRERWLRSNLTSGLSSCTQVFESA